MTNSFQNCFFFFAPISLLLIKHVRVACRSAIRRSQPSIQFQSSDPASESRIPIAPEIVSPWPPLLSMDSGHPRIHPRRPYPDSAATTSSSSAPAVPWSRCKGMLRKYEVRDSCASGFHRSSVPLQHPHKTLTHAAHTSQGHTVVAPCSFPRRRPSSSLSSLPSVVLLAALPSHDRSSAPHTHACVGANLTLLLRPSSPPSLQRPSLPLLLQRRGLATPHLPCGLPGCWWPPTSILPR